MARKRNDLGPAADAKIRSLMLRGGTARSIFEALRAAGVKGASERTIARRMKEARAGVNATRAKKFAGTPPRAAAKSTRPPQRGKQPPPPENAEPLPATEEEIARADPATLDRWLQTATRMGDAAEALGDLDSLAKMGRLSVSLLEAKRKATPPPKEDPNDHPDMIAMGARVADQLHMLIDKIAKAWEHTAP